MLISKVSICTLIPQPGGLTTRRGLIRKCFDIPSLSFHLGPTSWGKLMPTDLPPLARGLHSRKPATQEMWIQGKNLLSAPWGRTFLVLIRTVNGLGSIRSWSQALRSGTKAAGDTPLVFSEILFILISYLHEDPHACWERRIKHVLQNAVLTNAYIITTHVTLWIIIRKHLICLL